MNASQFSTILLNYKTSHRLAHTWSARDTLLLAAQFFIHTPRIWLDSFNLITTKNLNQLVATGDVFSLRHKN